MDYHSSSKRDPQDDNRERLYSSKPDNMIIAVEIYYMVLEGEINRMIIAVMERY